MIYFSDCQDRVEHLILCVLWFMPWASADDIASVGRFSVQHVRRYLRHMADEGDLFRLDVGRQSVPTTRCLLAPRGIARFQEKHPEISAYPYTAAEIKFLLRDIERLEVIYPGAARLWVDSKDDEIRGGVRIRTGTEIEPKLVADEQQLRGMRLDGFVWRWREHIDALAIYRNPNAEADVIVPIIGGRHTGKPIPSGMKFFSGVKFLPATDLASDGLDDVVDVANPVTVLAVVDDLFAAFCLRKNAPGHATAIFHVEGARLDAARLRRQDGEYSDPQVGTIRTETVENLASLLAELKTADWDPRLLGKLERRALRLVKSWQAVDITDAIRRLGPTNGTQIRKAFNRLTERGYLGQTGGICHMGKLGIAEWNTLDRLPVETVPPEMEHLLNADGSLSKRKLKRAAEVARIGLLLRKDRYDAALGQRADISVLPEYHPAIDPYHPDLYWQVPFTNERIWYPVEYVDSETQCADAKERLAVYAQMWHECDQREFKGLPFVMVVARTAEIADALKAAAEELGLPLVGFWRDQLIAQCRAGTLTHSHFITYQPITQRNEEPEDA